MHIRIHYDGKIARNHQVSMRTLGKTLVHLQNSMDRACLEMKHGALWKHAKMQQRFYEDAEFLVQQPKEGGYVLDFFANNSVTQAIIDRVSSAVNGAVEESTKAGLANGDVVKQGIIARRQQLEHQLVKPVTFQSIYDNPDSKITRRYGDRAIVREIDQILSIIRSSHAGDSTFELSLYGSRLLKFDFNKLKAGRFHVAVTRKELGQAIIYTAQVKSMDRHNLKGEIVNSITKKTATILFPDEESFQEVILYFGKKAEVSFFGCPLIEYGAFDPMAGDLYYLGLA